MATIKEMAVRWAERLAAFNSPELREKELRRVLDEIDHLTFRIAQPLRGEVRQNFYLELKDALLDRGFSFETMGLEKHGGLEWLTGSNTVGNEEVIELMKMVARGPGK